MQENTTQYASNYVKNVDNAFVIILGISILFLVAITITMLYFTWKYNKKRHPKAVQIEGSTTLEILWTVIPIVLVLGMFYYGWRGWNPMKTAPADSFVIQAEARMWNFAFIYPNGKRTSDLIVPKGKPIKLELKALDVIHSLYIPAFRIKEDMVPGRQKMMWFEPGKVGEYDIFCAEYCGLNHSYMSSAVKVLMPDEFDNWYIDTTKVAAKAGITPAEAGRQLMETTGCFACHTSDGTKLVGPTYKGLWGHKVTVVTAQGEIEVEVDADYIRSSIFYPNAQIVKGYSKGLMLPYKDALSNDDVDLIIEYLKTLADKK